MAPNVNPQKPTEVTITRAKGRPMLSWVGKKPLGRVTAFPAQAIERFSATTANTVPALGAGRYTLPAPPAGATVAVKVIDMLGEECVVRLTA